MNDLDAVSWNLIIGCAAKNGGNIASLQFFEQMLLQCCLPDKFVYASVLSACYESSGGKFVHARVVADGLEHETVLATALVNMYGKTDSLDIAQETFRIMDVHDVVSWNAMISIYAQHGRNGECILLFQTMLNQGVTPNEVTYVSVLSACANAAAIVKGCLIHTQILAANVKLNVFIATSLINMYGKCGSAEHARQIFDGVLKKDVIIWNAMIKVYVQGSQGNKALELFELMKSLGVKPSVTTFVATLEACTSQGALLEGKNMHAFIKKSGYECDIMVGTSLLNMYGKFGDLKEAYTIFDKLIDRNIVSWNALLASCAQGECGFEALQIFEQMLCEGVIPGKATFYSIVPVYAVHASLMECKRMHSLIINNECDSEEKLGAGIINMYGQRGRVEDAHAVFGTLPRSSVSLWTALIAAHDQNCQCIESIKLFHQMLAEGILPDPIAIASTITAFSNHPILVEGIHVHACIEGAEYDLRIDVQNAFVAMYGKLSELDKALMVFYRMLQRNVISWNGMIAVFLQHEMKDASFGLYQQMLHEGVMPDKITLVSMLSLCGSYGAMMEGSKLHAYIIQTYGKSKVDDSISSALISMYTNCGSFKDAQRVFENLKWKGVLPLAMMIEACSFHGDGETALMLFDRIQESGISAPKIAFMRVLSACSHLGLVNEAYCVLGCQNEDMLGVGQLNCLVDLLVRIGQVEEAEKLVNIMPFLPNALTWSTLINASRTINDVNHGVVATKFVFELEPDNTGTYVTLSNIFAAAAACSYETKIYDSFDVYI